MIVIRPARREDLTQLRKVAIESFHGTFAPHNTEENMNWFYSTAYSVEQFERELDETGTSCHLAWEGEELLGFARLRLNNETEKELGKNSIELQRLYIAPEHQGKKVGSALMQHILSYAVDHKFDWIWLGVWERNFGAQKFYTRWGFEKFGEHVFQMGDDPQIDWLLKKRPY